MVQLGIEHYLACKLSFPYSFHHTGRGNDKGAPLGVAKVLHPQHLLWWKDQLHRYVRAVQHFLQPSLQERLQGFLTVPAACLLHHLGCSRSGKQGRLGVLLGFNSSFR